MKRLVSGVLVCVMILSFASCSLSNDKRKGDRVNSDDIKAENKGLLDMSLESVISKTVHGLGQEYEDYLNLYYMDDAFSKDNSNLGIVNYGFIDYGNYEQHVGDNIIDTNSEIYIIEFDKSSNEYKKLNVGSTISVVRDGYTHSAVVSAINHQYVLCIYACQSVRDGATTEETVPRFTLAYTQGGYDAFIGLE